MSGKFVFLSSGERCENKINEPAGRHVSFDSGKKSSKRKKGEKIKEEERERIKGRGLTFIRTKINRGQRYQFNFFRTREQEMQVDYKDTNL